MLIYDAAGTGRSYDGEGRRVRKEVAGQATTVFVYDAFGQLAAEYGPADGIGDGPSNNDCPANPVGEVYCTPNHYGSFSRIQ